MEQQAHLSYQQGELLLEAPADLFIPDNPLQVSLADFSGPLDILLYLIRRNKLAIENIDITKIALQYEEYLKLMKQFNLQLAAEYLVMAAILAEIKSFALLPEPEEEAEHEDMRAALIMRLQEYQVIRELAQRVAELPRLNKDFWTFQMHSPRSPVHPTKAITAEQLHRAMTSVLTRQKTHRAYQIKEEELSTEDRIQDMLKRLRKARELKSNNGFISFENFLVFAEGRNGVAVTFISLLQLIRDKLIEVIQKGNYQRIFIRLQETQADEAPQR